MDLSYAVFLIFYQFAGRLCKKNYYVHHQEGSWFDAQTLCAKLNFSTPHPKTKSELNELTKQLSVKDAVVKGAWLGGYLLDKGWIWETDGEHFSNSLGCFSISREGSKTVDANVSVNRCISHCRKETPDNETFIGLMQSTKCFCLGKGETNRLRLLNNHKCDTKEVFAIWRHIEDPIVLRSFIGCHEAIEFEEIADNSLHSCQRHCRGSMAVALQGKRCACFPQSARINTNELHGAICRETCPGSPSSFCGNVTKGAFSVYIKSTNVTWDTDHPQDGRHCTSVDPRSANIMRSEFCSSERQYHCRFDNNNTEDNRSTWFYARDYCKSIGQPLIVPTRSSKFSNMSDMNRYWIGLRRDAVWVWNDGIYIITFLFIKGSNVTQDVDNDEVVKMKEIGKNCLSVRRQDDMDPVLIAAKCQTVLPVVCEYFTDETSEALTTTSTVNDAHISTVSTVGVINESERNINSNESRITDEDREDGEVTTDKKVTDKTSETLTNHEVTTDNNGFYIGVGIAVGVSVLLCLLAVIVIRRRKKRRQKRAVRAHNIVYDNTLSTEGRTSIRPAGEEENVSSLSVPRQGSYNEVYSDVDENGGAMYSSTSTGNTPLSNTESAQGSSEYSVARSSNLSPEVGIQDILSDMSGSILEYAQVHKKMKKPQSNTATIHLREPFVEAVYDKLGDIKSSNGDVGSSSNIYAHTGTDDALYETQGIVSCPDPDYSAFES